MIEIDLEALLQPVAADSPCGPDLRGVAGDETLRKINDLRKDVEPEDDPDHRGKSADWPGVVKLAVAALTGRSKDLQLAAHLTQGLVHKEGFPGLIFGLRATRGLLERYWDGLHPGVENGKVDLEVRAGWLHWLGGGKEFLASVKRVPLAHPPGGPARSWFDLEEGRRLDQAGREGSDDLRQQLMAAGLISSAQWRQALGATPAGDLEQTIADIAQALEEVAALERLVEERFPDKRERPGFIELRDLLAEGRKELDRARSGGGGPREPSPGGGGPGDEPGKGPAAPPAPGGPIASRKHAYQILKDVADYLRRVEPHSPAPLLIDRAVKWGEMDFKALLEDVVKHGDVRAQVRELLGLPPDVEQ